MATIPTRLLFPLGEIKATPGALDLLSSAQLDLMALLSRHQSGDWGAVCAEDARANSEAIVTGARILSNYPITSNADRIWIITEADRRTTTLLLPEEY